MLSIITNRTLLLHYSALASCAVFLLLEMSWSASKYLGSIKGMRDALLWKRGSRTLLGSNSKDSALYRWGLCSSIRNLSICCWLTDSDSSGHFWRIKSNGALKYTGLEWVFHPILTGKASTYFIITSACRFMAQLSEHSNVLSMHPSCVKLKLLVIHISTFQRCNLWYIFVFSYLLIMKLEVWSVNLL